MANSNFRTIGADYLEGINGERNYIRNAHAKDNTIGYNGYNDGSVAAPIDGTGGVVTGITFTRSTTTPLSGEASFEFAKDAVNRQGQGFAVDFTIDRADQAKVLQIEFDYERVSGTYVTGDLTAYIVDVTNNVVIQPSAFQIENVGTPSTARMTFQTASNSTSYRLCFHVASTSALAYTLRLDNIRVSPQVVPLGAPVTDWVSYTPTGSNTGTRAGRWRRVGDSMQIESSFIYTSGAAQIDLDLPPGFSIDTAKLTQPNTNGEASLLGIAKAWDLSTSTPRIGSIIYNTATRVRVYDATTSNLWSSSANNPWTWASGDSANFNLIVPIAGWSSSTVVSSSADTRVVAGFFGKTGGAQALTALTTPISFQSTVQDTHAGWNGTDTYTVRVPGTYELTYNGGSTSAANYSVYLNGTSFTTFGGTTSTVLSSNTALLPNLSAGTTIQVRALDTTTTATTANLQIKRLSGPSQIAASEVVAMTSVGNPTGGASAGAIIIYPTAAFDSHAAYNSGTGRYTCPAPGLYEVNAVVNGTNAVVVAVNKNGTSFGTLTFTAGGFGTGSVLVPAVAGDLLDIRTSGNIGAFSGSSYSIKRIGGIG